MKIADAQRCLSLYKDTAKRVEAIATQLRGVGLLPKGGRGPHAPDASAEQIGLLALAVAGVDKVAEAVEVAARLAMIVDCNGRRLLDVMTDAISDPVVAHSILHIRVDATFPRAELTLRESRHCDLFFSANRWNDPQFFPDAQGQGFAGRIGHIGGGVLEQLALEFTQGDDTGGWVA